MFSLYSSDLKKFKNWITSLKKLCKKFQWIKTDETVSPIWKALLQQFPRLIHMKLFWFLSMAAVCIRHLKGRHGDFCCVSCWVLRFRERYPVFFPPPCPQYHLCSNIESGKHYHQNKWLRSLQKKKCMTFKLKKPSLIRWMLTKTIWFLTIRLMKHSTTLCWWGWEETDILILC